MGCKEDNGMIVGIFSNHYYGQRSDGSGARVA
jgi:hypothetical protein